MSKTVKEWENNFRTLGDVQQLNIVDALATLAEWPLFKEQYSELGMFQLGLGFYAIICGTPEQRIIDKFLG